MSSQKSHPPQPAEGSGGGPKLSGFLKENKAVIFSLFLFGSLFYLMVGTLFDHTLYAGYPFTFFAADSFSHFVITEAALEQGHYLYIPPYLSHGVENVLPHYGPGIVHLMALTTKLLGTDAFNIPPLLFGAVLLFLPFIFLAGLQMPWEVKLLSLAFIPLLLVSPFSIGYLWGQYGSFLGTFFLFLLFYALNEEKFRKPAVIGIILSAIAISHFPELVFAMIYICFFLAADFARSKAQITPAGVLRFFLGHRALLYGFLAFLLLSGFYLMIFYYGNFKALKGDAVAAYTFQSVTPSAANRDVVFSNFPQTFQALILAGAAVMLFSTKGISGNSKLVLLSIALFTNFNYIAVLPTIAYRAFQHRYLWPITLAAFAAVAVSFSFSLVSRRIAAAAKYKAYIFAVVFLALFSLSLANFRPVQGPGVVSKDQFEAIRFLENHNTSGGDILLLYGYGYDQSTWAIKKLRFHVSQQQMLKTFKEGLDMEPISIFQPVTVLKSRFNNGRIEEVPPYKEPEKTICGFRYYMFDRFGMLGDQRIAFNQIFLDRIDKSKFRVLYNNVQTVILENMGGEECLN